MFRNPYDTTIGMLLGIGFNNLSKEILLFAQTHGDQVRNADNPAGDANKSSMYNGMVYQVQPGLGRLPTFAHPVTIPNEWTSKDDINKNYAYDVYVDVRNFTRLNLAKDVVISSQTDYEFTCLRGWLQAIWCKTENSFNDILTLGPYPLAMFARVMSALLVRRFGLNPDVQMRITIILAYFYLCMFKDVPADEPTMLDERGYLEISRMITQGTYIEASDVIPVVSVIPVMRNVKELVAALKEHGNTIRFEQLNEAILLELVATIWAGSNYREVAQVAIEHPPTWCAMLYTVLDQRGFANCYLAKACKDYSRGDMDENFVKHVRFLFR